MKVALECGQSAGECLTLVAHGAALKRSACAWSSDTMLDASFAELNVHRQPTATRE